MTYEEMRATQIAKAQSTEGWGRVPHFIASATLRTQFLRRPYSQLNTPALDAQAKASELAQNRKHFT